MLAVVALAVALNAAPCAAAAVAEARAVSSFPTEYLQSVAMSLSAQPLYGSHFLNSFQAQVAAVAASPAPSAAAAYLETAATGGSSGLADLRAGLGKRELSPEKASALLIANSLVRPGQFREVMDGLETLRPGLGRHAAAILSSASGPGDGRLLAALRAAGERRPQGAGLTYGPDGRWATMFDGGPAVRDGAPAQGGGAVAVRPRDAAPDIVDAEFHDVGPVSGAVLALPEDDAARARLPALTKPR